jgi:hypothetical protein
LATLASFGLVRLDQPDQPRPRNHRLHLGQEPLTPGDFALPIPFHRCERPRIPHPHTFAPADPTNGLYQNRNTCAERFPSGRTFICRNRETVARYAMATRSKRARLQSAHRFGSVQTRARKHKDIRKNRTARRGHQAFAPFGYLEHKARRSQPPRPTRVGSSLLPFTP